MQRRLSARVRHTLVAVLSLLPACAAHAADTAHGQQIYNSICAQCHNAGGSPGPGPIMLGANNPANIVLALNSVDEMAPFASILSSKDIEDVAAYLGVRFGIAPPPEPPTAVAVEYYHAAFDHYFVTAIADEIAKLDDGTFAGWARTGESFKAYAAGTPGAADVCRFFSTAFSPKSSHFYTPSATECATVKGNPNWQFEAVVFGGPTPDSAGTCAPGTQPLYRLYNNGQGAAPNHRYTTSLATRQAMLAKGWIPEGNGALGVIACSPL